MSIKTRVALGSAALALGLFFSAFPVQAAGLTDTQIQAIISLLTSFGADSNTISNVSNVLYGLPSTGGPGNGGPPPHCVLINDNLSFGSTDAATDGEVSTLQEFLGVRQTGYFGPMTESAIESFQSGDGIVSSGSPDTTGFGAVGPATRKALGNGCSGTSIVVNTPTYPASTSLAVSCMGVPYSSGLGASWQSAATGGSGSYTYQWTLLGDATVTGEGGIQSSALLALYNTAGTKQASVVVNDGHTSATANCSVAVGQTQGAAATIDPSSLSTSTSGNSTASVTLTGTATGVSQVALIVNNSSGNLVGQSNSVSVVNGHWTALVQPSLGVGTYKVTVYGPNTGSGAPTLAMGVLTIAATGGSASPTCMLMSDKASYNFGDTVTLTWSSVGATSASWQQNSSSGKDNVVPPAATPGTQGSATVVANVYGNPSVTLNVSGSGGSSSCTATFSVPLPPPPAPVTASIDSSSLSANTGTPTITGTASGAPSSFGITIGSGPATATPSGDKVYGSGNIQVVNGLWSVTVSPALSSGTYGVYVYGNNALLTSGTLTIAIPTTTLSASPTSGTAPLNVVFSGIAAGGSYTISFGDGHALASGCTAPTGSTACVGRSVTPSYTYSSAGTYVATLSSGGSSASTTITVN